MRIGMLEMFFNLGPYTVYDFTTSLSCTSMHYLIHRLTQCCKLYTCSCCLQRTEITGQNHGRLGSMQRSKCVALERAKYFLYRLSDRMLLLSDF